MGYICLLYVVSRLCKESHLWNKSTSHNLNNLCKIHITWGMLLSKTLAFMFEWLWHVCSFFVDTPIVLYDNNWSTAWGLEVKGNQKIHWFDIFYMFLHEFQYYTEQLCLRMIKRWLWHGEFGNNRLSPVNYGFCCFGAKLNEG